MCFKDFNDPSLQRDIDIIERLLLYYPGFAGSGWVYLWSVKILLEYRLLIVEIQILRLLIVLSTPNQCNNRRILHFQFIKRKRRNFTVIVVELYDY